MQEGTNKGLIGSINSLTNTIDKLTNTIALGYNALGQKEPKGFVHMKALNLSSDKVKQGVQHKQIKAVLQLYGVKQIADLPAHEIPRFCGQLDELKPIASETINEASDPVALKKLELTHIDAQNLHSEKINQGLQHKQVKDLLHLFGQNEILDLPTDKVAYFCAELAQLEPITVETVRALATAKVKEGIIGREIILGFLEQAKAPRINDLSEKDLLELNTWLKEVKPVNKKLDNL